MQYFESNEFFRSSGGQLPALAAAAMTCDRDGGNIDAQMQARKMEAVGRLAGGIAHDFNNILSVILGYSEILQDRIKDEDLREMAAEIHIAAGRAADLTRRLLTFTRRRSHEQINLSLNDVVTGIEKMLRRLIPEDVEIATALAEDLHPVRADRSQIEQVILNLCLNARDAMPRGGRLIIATINAQPSRAVLTIADTGMGMTDETRRHLFEPHFTTKEAGKGAGLGLSIVDEVVRRHGGAIRVDSAPGAGTVFTVSLPAIKEGGALYDQE